MSPLNLNDRSLKIDSGVGDALLYSSKSSIVLYAELDFCPPTVEQWPLLSIFQLIVRQTYTRSYDKTK